MSEIFVTADLHFGHTNIINYCNRPFVNAEEMDRQLIEKWNSVVGKDDKVYVLGDFSMYGQNKTQMIVSALKGRKVLIMGNHDRGRNIKWWYDAGFNEVYKHGIVYEDFIIMCHEPPTFIERDSPYFYIYGHVHDSENYVTKTSHSLCACVERWEYKPVSLTKLMKGCKVA